MYHIIANLELRFDSLDDALSWANSRPRSWFEPKVPYTAMPEEDKTTPRICGAPTLEGCVTALSPIGTFRRCLNANEDAKSYENDEEVYPVFVVTFSDSHDWVKPTKEQVPDVQLTDEHWLLAPALPTNIELKWLDAYSIDIKEDEDTCKTVCTGIRFVDNLTSMHHPWLDGKGHPLDSSDMGGDIWPNPELAHTDIYFDCNFGGQLCYMRPLQPYDGRCRVYPLSGDIAPYNSFLHKLRRFSGFYDLLNRPLLEGYLVEYRGVIGTLTFMNGISWTVVPHNCREEPLVLRPEDVQTGNRICNLKALAYENIRMPNLSAR